MWKPSAANSLNERTICKGKRWRRSTSEEALPRASRTICSKRFLKKGKKFLENKYREMENKYREMKKGKKAVQKEYIMTGR